MHTVAKDNGGITILIDISYYSGNKTGKCVSLSYDDFT